MSAGWSLQRLLPVARMLGGYVFAGMAGLAAAWAVREHIQQRTQALEEQARVPTVPRLVAAQDLPAGATLDMEVLAIREVPESWAASDSLPPQAVDSVEGGQLALPIKAGEPLLRHQVVKAHASAPTARQLGEGRRAFSLPLREIRDLPQQVRADDSIDLYVSFHHEGRNLTVPVLQGGKVLSVDGDDAGQPASITLEAAAGDALKVVAARQNGTLTALLRPTSDAHTRMNGEPRDLPAMLGLGQEGARRPPVVIVYGDRVEGDAADRAHDRGPGTDAAVAGREQP